MTRTKPVDCTWCGTRHMPKFLCDPAAAVLQQVSTNAAGLNSGPGAGADGRVMMTHFTVVGCTLPVGDETLPALVLSGRDQHGNRLPDWLLVAREAKMHAVLRRFDHQGRNAVAEARRGRRSPGGVPAATGATA